MLDRCTVVLCIDVSLLGSLTDAALSDADAAYDLSGSVNCY